MKKKFIIILFLNCSLIVFSQPDCRWATTSEALLKLMAKKPIDNLYYGLFKVGCNVTPEVRKRLLYLLDWHWTKEEIDDYCETNFNEDKDFYRIDEKAKSLSKGIDSIYKVVYDSIKSKLRTSIIGTVDYGVNGNLVLGAAQGNVREAIPILRKAIHDGHYNPINVELALARFGDKIMEKKALERIKYTPNLNGAEWIDTFYISISEKFRFISSQASIYKIHEWLDTSKSYLPYSYNGIKKYPPVKSAIHILLALKLLIANLDFQKILSSLHYKKTEGFSDTAIILAIKEWMIKNKGKYKLTKVEYMENPWDMEDF